MVRIWTKNSTKFLSSINIGAACNSIACANVNGIPTYLVAGTFNGGVSLVSIKEEKVIKTVEKRHDCYVSSMCTLTKFKSEYVCSISADKIIVWRVENL
jgi:hypothetical protein